MKKLSFLLIAILISLSSLAQTIEIPIYLLDSITDELVVKDGMEATINLQNREITVYKHKDSVQTAIIAVYKLNEADYLKIIANLKELNTISAAEKKDLEREIRRIKIRFWLVTAGGVILVILLI